LGGGGGRVPWLLCGFTGARVVHSVVGMVSVSFLGAAVG